MILSKPQKAKAATGNMHLFWTGASAPDGWTIVSDGGGEDFYQIFPKGAATYSAAAAGATTHTHTYSAIVQDSGAAGRRGTTGSTVNAPIHIGHLALSPGITAASNLPVYRNLKVIEYTTGGVPATIPAGAIAIFDAAPPAGWTSISGDGGNYNLKFPRAAEDATTAAGSNTHTHTMSAASISAAGAGTVANFGAGAYCAIARHTHTITNNTVATLTRDNIPPYIDVILASKDLDGTPSTGMIGMFDDTLSYGWTSVSGASQPFNGKYIRGNTSYDATGGGALTNDHDKTGGESDVYVASDGEGGTTLPCGTSVNTTAAWNGHTHAVLFSNFNAANHEPPNISVIFAKRTAVYEPQSYNWQWYADEEDEAPGTVYANENTAPPAVEMGKSIGFKLRVNFNEVGGVTGSDSRKNLQYSTSTSGSWTAVGSTSDTDKLFRYYNGGGNDNVTLSSTLLTGSSGLYIGIHNESSSANPNYSDQQASSIAEFEYCIENYDAVANTLYYFSFNDETAGQVPVYSGKSYPSLTTASAYDLTISAPSAVDLGNWSIGSSAYAEYAFVTNEEITIRDNRGQTSGDSSGWSCTAEISTELKDVIIPSDISAPVFNGIGLNNMTAYGVFIGAVTTYYKVQIDGGGSPNTFRWSDDGGLTWDQTNRPCTPSTPLNNGVYVGFATSVGHVVGDYWTFTATPEVANTIIKDNMYFITNTITGLYDAATTGISSESRKFMDEAVTAALVSGSGKQGLGGFQFKPILRVYNADTPGDYEGVITFTLT